MSFETIRYETAGPVATITLDRPERLNTIVPPMPDEVQEAVGRAARDADVKVVVLRGAGRAFCGGYDFGGGFKHWGDALETDGRWDPGKDFVMATAPEHSPTQKLASVWRCPKPVIAQVHGYALAGGLELAMACDLIVAAEDAQLGEPEIRFGSAPVTLLMPFLVGQKKTRELLFTGDLVDGREAERIGLVNRAVPADRLAAEVDALADRLARVPPDVMAPTKLMLNRAMEASGFLAAVDSGLDLQSFVNMSETAREFDAVVRRDGLKAALAWRDARYDERLADAARRRHDEPPD
jgi:enoyl-CoA hydratase